MKVAEVMATKVVTIPGDLGIREIARTLVQYDISGVPVVNEKGEVVGIVSEGDLLHKETNPRIPDFIGILGATIYYRGTKEYESDFKKLIAVKASEIMTDKVISINKEATIEEAADKMVRNNIRRLPVMEDGKLIGIVTRMDIIKTLING